MSGWRFKMPRKKPAIVFGYVGCLRTQTSSFA